MATYYVAVNGQHTGPFTVEQLSGMNLTPDTLVWNDSMPNWTEAGKVAELQSLFYAPQPGYQQQPMYQQPGYQQQGYQYLQVNQRTVGFGEAIKLFFSNYATFYGRSSRSEYWFVTLFNFLVVIILYILAIITAFSSLGTSGLILGLLSVYYLATIIPSLALCWRRLHDIGKSGGWYFIGLIPIVGPILLLVWFCTESQPYENEYGPVPNTDSEY